MMTKCLALWKKKKKDKRNRTGAGGVDLATNTQNHKVVAVKKERFIQNSPPSSDRTPNPPVNTTVS